MLFMLHGEILLANNIINGDSRLGEYLPQLRNKRVALIINQTSIINGTILLDTLLKNNVNVVKIFVPEHGLRGSADAGATVSSGKDSATGLPVISLYGKNKKPQKEQLNDVDVIVYDLQDVGARFYTYINTLQYAMEAAAENDKTFMVLDRPNPNGFYVDGPVLDTGERSFVGMQPIPIVYGMTAGEYAQMLKGEHWFHDAEKLHLNVISCEGYDHNKKYNLPVAPSPNLKTMAAIYYYPSLCLFEGTTISVGRGTDMPFQQWGSPELEGKYTYSFTPQKKIGATNPMYEGKACYGVLLPASANEALSIVDGRFHIEWVIEAYNKSSNKGSFFIPFFDKLAGTAQLKNDIVAGKSAGEIKKGWQKDISAFKKIRKKYLLYTDFE
jgi:uncharacterized protein YbbC (DUF1343 family)